MSASSSSASSQAYTVSVKRVRTEDDKEKLVITRRATKSPTIDNGPFASRLQTDKMVTFDAKEDDGPVVSILRCWRQQCLRLAGGNERFAEKMMQLFDEGGTMLTGSTALLGLLGPGSGIETKDLDVLMWPESDFVGAFLQAAKDHGQEWVRATADYERTTHIPIVLRLQGPVGHIDVLCCDADTVKCPERVLDGFVGDWIKIGCDFERCIVLCPESICKRRFALCPPARAIHMRWLRHLIKWHRRGFKIDTWLTPRVLLVVLDGALQTEVRLVTDEGDEVTVKPRNGSEDLAVYAIDIERTMSLNEKA